MLKVEKITTCYGDKPALHDVSIHIGVNEIVSMMGANGAGKTTLLNTISGILHPKIGEIYFLSEKISYKSPWKIVELGIVQVPEGRQLFPTMTVYENILMGAASIKKSKMELNRDLEWIYNLFPRLKERLGQKAGSLSGGEGQMLAIARGLVRGPKLLLLDEPSQGLSPLLIKMVSDLLGQFKEKGVTILLVEQNIAIPRAQADRIYLMQSGVILSEGLKSKIMEEDLVKRIYLGTH